MYGNSPIGLYTATLQLKFTYKYHKTSADKTLAES